MVRKPRKRRGIVLLIVLSLLILFLLIGITFLVISGTYRGGAEAHSMHEQTGDDPEALAHSAVLQLLSGPARRASSILGHAMLADLYGNDWATGNAGSGSVLTGSNGQFVQINYTGLKLGLPRNNTGRNGYYDGCVLTMLDGPAAGFSTRIVGYFPTSATDGKLHVEMFHADTSDLQNLLANNNSAYVFDGRHFLINGREFNGTGAGYDHNTFQLDKAENGRPFALQPHFAAYASTTSNFNRGGLDESWDAVDYQNMFLASVPPEVVSAADIVPSFHRPSLVRYWGGSTGLNYVLRPDPTIHPKFVVNNQDFDPVNGPWDVDNDGDGITDSIWIDLGFPVKQTDDGRLYKPLFAMMVVDMDGRLNVNAHGNLAHVDPTFRAPIPTGGAAAGSPGASVQVRRGQGYSPAEIDLVGMLGAIPASQLIKARYGVDGLPGEPNSDDLFSGVKSVGVPGDYYGSTPLTSYGSPPDLFGRGATILSHTGHPLMARMALPGETNDDPCEINLNDPNSYDELFTVAELERLLRFNDVDSVSLPNRLFMTTPTYFDNATNRRRVTTHSFDIPTPNIFVEGMVSASVMDLYINRLFKGGVADADIPTQVGMMMPFELLHGGRMNVNRLWGNGQDDNNNGVVDESIEVNGESIFGQTPPGYANDYPGAQNIPAKQIYARHLYCLMMLLVDPLYAHPTSGSDTPSPELTARRIAQWAVNCVDYRDPDGIMTPFEYDINPWNGWDVDGDLATDEGDVRGFVFGCESADLIMTETLAFHDRRVQDTDMEPSGKKRIDDSGTPKVGDLTLDQLRIPQGSLFIELYATRNHWVSTTGSPGVPRELYDGTELILDKKAGSSPVWRIIIGPGSSDADSNGDENGPETRAQSNPDTVSFNPLDMNLLNGPPEPLGGVGGSSTPIERVIWFADPNGSAVKTDLDSRFSPEHYYQRTSNPLMLLPGAYAVVGPRGNTPIGSQVTDSTLDSRQEVVLTTPVHVLDLNGTTTGRTNNVQNSFDIICTADAPAGWTGDPIGVSISEPRPTVDTYYDNPTHLNEYYNDPAVAGAGTALDDPLDSQDGMPLMEDDMLETAMYSEYKSCYLQRLANPLVEWNTLTNPYITVDWATIDLSVFSGSDAEPSGWTNDSPTGIGPFDLDDPDPAAEKKYFGTRQRGVVAATDILETDRFWSPLTQQPRETPEEPAPTTDVHFRYALLHTLGYLNGDANPSDSITGSLPIASSNSPEYLGDPESPFPWINIANRPFATHLELMQVPASGPSRILWEMSVATGDDPYVSGTDEANFRGPYRHLLNFFHGDDTNGTAGANFYRILDYLEVPSRFVGTERWYTPATFNATNTDTQAVGSYRAPFNRLSRFRNPGLVNINTIPEGETGKQMWRAISGLPQPASDAQWRAIELSRHGDASNLPTRIPGVFQSAGSAHLAPIPALQRRDIDGTLLRSNINSNSNTPLLADHSTEAYNDTNRNASFRYAGISRLGNMITTHSNVYAVWVTVGYFEVSESPTEPRYRLGQEVGSDTGEISRHRAFYMIDRSIPVAYQPGESHNVDRCIIHRRFIE